MAVRNGARYLAAASESLREQTLQDVEIVVLDNASRDESPEILAAWASGDPRVRIERSDRRLGAIEAIAGLAGSARAELVMWAPQQAVWTPDYAEVLSAQLAANANADLAVAHASERDAAGYECASTAWAPDSAAATLNHRQYLLRAANIGWCAGIYRRQALALGLHAAARYPQDWATEFMVLLPLLLAGRVCGTNDARVVRHVEPREPPPEAGIYRDFMTSASKALAETQDLSPAERAYLMPFVAAYAARHAQPLRRFMRRRMAAG